MSTPQSVINICSGVRLDNRYQHSIYFPNATKQLEYFAGKVVRTLSAYSYLRKSWPLQVEATMEQARTWSYLYFRNSSSGKIYYYFITNVEYKNDNMVELSLELDVLQTYQEVIRNGLLPCLIERQHTPTDLVGEHTVDEGLDVGDLTANHSHIIDPGEFCIMLMCSINPASTTKEQADIMAKPYLYNKVFSGIKFWAIDVADWQEWGDQLETLVNLGQGEAITAMWMYPKELVVLGGEDRWDNDQLIHVVERAKSMHLSDLDTTVNALTDFQGYPPKNNKLLCYPYNFIMATNHQGRTAVYKFERSHNANQLKFRLSGALGPEGGAQLTPIDYNGQLYAYNEGLDLANYPTCAWNSDTYKLWLAQNQNTHRMSNISSAVKVAAGAGIMIAGIATTATGVGAVAGVGGIATGMGMVASGVTQAADLHAQKADRDIEPPQARGGYSTTNNITNGRHVFELIRMQITNEMAYILDEYFTMYGYKIKRVQTPNLKARPAFTYVKTIGCKIAGDLCSSDLVAIENIFDRGITWWTNGDKLGDYTQDNKPTTP